MEFPLPVNNYQQYSVNFFKYSTKPLLGWSIRNKFWANFHFNCHNDQKRLYIVITWAIRRRDSTLWLLISTVPTQYKIPITNCTSSNVNESPWGASSLSRSTVAIAKKENLYATVKGLNYLYRVFTWTVLESIPKKFTWCS